MSGESKNKATQGKDDRWVLCRRKHFGVDGTYRKWEEEKAAGKEHDDGTGDRTANNTIERERHGQTVYRSGFNIFDDCLPNIWGSWSGN